jgi:hypothetical protein
MVKLILIEYGQPMGKEVLDMEAMKWVVNLIKCIIIKKHGQQTKSKMFFNEFNNESVYIKYFKA